MNASDAKKPEAVERGTLILTTASGNRFEITDTPRPPVSMETTSLYTMWTGSSMRARVRNVEGWQFIPEKDLEPPPFHQQLTKRWAWVIMGFLVGFMVAGILR